MREDVIRMAREAGWNGLYITWTEPTGKPDWSPCAEMLIVHVAREQIERFAALVAAAERERCAKICDAVEVHDVGHPGTAFAVQALIGAAIRALP